MTLQSFGYLQALRISDYFALDQEVRFPRDAWNQKAGRSSAAILTVNVTCQRKGLRNLATYLLQGMMASNSGNWCLHDYREKCDWAANFSVMLDIYMRMIAFWIQRDEWLIARDALIWQCNRILIATDLILESALVLLSIMQFSKLATAYSKSAR